MGNRFAETEKSLRAGLLQKAPELLDSAALILLALYPLRNIHIGGDLMDTGYNYANFRYMGTEHMDPMWLFSTYLGNSLGHLFSMLPFGHSILGLNFYTGLVLSLIAVISYLFCTRKLRTGTAPAMIGIFLALNLCWCPTALLYNYLTYLFLLAALICLYRGLTADRFGPLLVAGFLLGLNVFVRFPNVAQISLVAILWIYGFFEHPVNLKAESKKVRGREIRENLRNAALRTLHVLGGYLSALFIMLLYLGIRYGFSSYFEGIARLFQMTDTASDYQASSMLRGILLGFWKQSYWMVRILFFAFAGCLLCSGAKYLERRFGALFREDRQVRDYRHGFSFLKTAYALSGVAAAGMAVWLVTRRNANGDPAFTSNVYYSYDPIVAPATVFLACVIAVAAIRTFSRKAELSERLISMLIAGQILISCIGSNNGLFPGFNNLFLGAPYLLWQGARFLRQREWRYRWVSLFGLKAVAVAFGLLCLVQFTAFGWTFTFSGGTGVRGPFVYITGNAVYDGVRMNEDRAKNLAELTNYVNFSGLKGKEVILFGNIPALSYYLEMPSAFNPWCDLASYGRSVFAVQLMNQTEAPVIIIGRRQIEADGTLLNEKWRILRSYMDEYGYRETFRNEEFIVYE